MIQLLPWTPRDPLNIIGYCAGVCRNSETNLSDKNITRAKNCIKSGHGRVLEYPDIYFVMYDVSARMARQFYTHTIGITKLQESTRYVKGASGFQYPSNLKPEQEELLKSKYDTIMDMYNDLIEQGVSIEDAANVLPLGMHTTVMVKMNLRALVHMAHERLCTHALKEFREVMNQIKEALSEWSDEWKWICDNMLVPKCVALGKCPELNSCKKILKG